MVYDTHKEEEENAIITPTHMPSGDHIYVHITFDRRRALAWSRRSSMRASASCSALSFAASFVGPSSGTTTEREREKPSTLNRVARRWYLSGTRLPSPGDFQTETPIDGIAPLSPFVQRVSWAYNVMNPSSFDRTRSKN